VESQIVLAQQLHHRLQILFAYSIIMALFRPSLGCLDCLTTCEEFSLCVQLSKVVDPILQSNRSPKRLVELEETQINFSFRSFVKSSLYYNLELRAHLSCRSH